MENILQIFKTNKIIKIFLAALILNVILGGAYYFIYIKIQEKNHGLLQLFSDVQILTEKKEGLANVKEKIIETEDIRTKLDGYFISKDGVVNFLNSIQALGSKKGLALVVSSVSVDPAPVSPNVLNAVNLQIVVTGQWASVYNFLAMLELMPLRVIINNVSVDKVSSGQITSGGKNIGGSGPAWKGIFDISVLQLK